MVNALQEIKDDALECSELHTRISHRLNARIPVLDLHRGASIDNNEHIDVSLEQIQSCLLHADVRFTAVQDDRVAI